MRKDPIAGYGSPQRSYWFFLEYRRRATLIGEVDGSQEGFGLRIVRHGDASASPRRLIEAIPATEAVAPIVSVGRSNTPGTSSAPAAALSPRPSRASIRLHRQRTSVRIHQVQPLLACCS